MSEGKIFVIDDEPVMCELLRDLLQERGFEVSYVTNPLEGIEKIKKEDFDVIVTDLKMPQIDGLSLIKEIFNFLPDAVIVVITGYPSFETVQAALKMGAYNYIAKPFNIDEVSFIMKKAVAFRYLNIANKKLIKEINEHNEKLEEKVKERTAELGLIYKIAQDITSTLKLDETLTVIIDRITSALKIEMCSILLLDNKTQELTIKASKGLTEDVIKNTHIKLGEKISGWVLKNKQDVLVEDIEKDPRFAKRNHEKYYTHSFISVPLIIKDKPLGVLNVNNKISKEPFNENDFRFLKGISGSISIAIENAQLYTSLENTYLNTISALTSAIDIKDHYTHSHSDHVTKYALAIAQELGLPEEEICYLKQACQLHDLGKIGIHDTILSKTTKLTEKEWEEIKKHPLKSVDILKPLDFLKEVITLVEQHHERYDGKGYPYGLKGEQIRIGARIIAVADSFDAMTTERPYRKALSIQEAIEEIKRNRGIQFDPNIVDVFLKIIPKLINYD
ncbi:MAG: response regulator [Candidatus Omnitrophica bacterium]|nr:response regulator [Candidatus Omnitrophota bacterium]